MLILAVIPANIFHKEQIRKNSDQLKFRIDFFQKVEIFNQMSTHKLQDLFKHLKEIKISKTGNIIYKEGDLAKYIYIIKSGKIELSKRFEITDPILLEKTT